MPDPVEVTENLLPPRIPWNKGELIGPKPPLRPKHVWSIRMRLQVEGRTVPKIGFDLSKRLAVIMAEIEREFPFKELLDSAERPHQR
jgi:hypothetical protein